jgi:biotin--protein ligase
MTSLHQLLPPSSHRRANLSIERTAAVILSKFEEMWKKFVDAKGSFEPFLEGYLNRWMHRCVLLSFPLIPFNIIPILVYFHVVDIAIN